MSCTTSSDDIKATAASANTHNATGMPITDFMIHDKTLI